MFVNVADSGPTISLYNINRLVYVINIDVLFLFLSFRRVLNVIYSFLGNFPASEF